MEKPIPLTKEKTEKVLAAMTRMEAELESEQNPYITIGYCKETIRQLKKGLTGQDTWIM